MSLADINEEIHRRSRETEAVAPGEAPRSAPPSIMPPTSSEPIPEVPLGVAWGGQEKHDEPVAPGLKLRNPFSRLPKKIALILGGVAILAVSATLLFKGGSWLFVPENVKVTIEGPKRVESNATAEYLIRYENNNWVDLTDAELIISYPEMFHLAPMEGLEVSASRAVLTLGTVKKSSLNSLVLKGSFQSLQDQVALFTATLRAAPEGVESRIDASYQYSVAIESSALVVELVAPSQAGDGQFVDYVVTYRNENTERIDNLELRLDYPSGFTAADPSVPPVRGDNAWSISGLDPGESGVITIRGTMAGAQGDVKRVKARLGIPQGDGTLLSYAEIERQTRVVASPLVIFQKIGTEEKKSVLPGERIPYRLVFRNDGDVGLRDLIVTVDLDPAYFDVSEIDLGDGGNYNSAKKQVIFRASDRKVLSLIEPGRSGDISFSIPVRSDLVGFRMNNIELESIARIDSPDVPTPIGANKIVGSNRIAFKVKTDPVLQLQGYHFDSHGNIGPVPPIVGQETTYTLLLRVGSTFNAIDDARVVLAIPGQVRYLKTHAVGQGAVVYNDRTGEIAWNIGTLPPGTDRLTELAIQVGFTPDPSQVGAEAKIVNSATFTGRDLWTEEAVSKNLPSKNIRFSEDPQLMDLRGGEVQKAI